MDTWTSYDSHDPGCYDFRKFKLIGYFTIVSIHTVLSFTARWSHIIENDDLRRPAYPKLRARARALPRVNESGD